MSFTYLSYRELKTYLGQLDAMIELNELALHEFRRLAVQSGDVETAIRSASDRHNIRVNFAVFPNLSTRMSQNYIVIVYESAERFLHEFRAEHTKWHGRDWVGDIPRKSRLQLTLQNIAPSFNKGLDYLGKARFSAFEYYRYLRNRIVHPHTVYIKKTSDRFRQIDGYRKELGKLYKVQDAPHRLDEVSFEDFILFSRVTKDIAYFLCQLGRPSDKMFAQSIDLNQFKKYQNNPQRLRRAIEGELRTKFGLDNAGAEKVASLLMAH